MNWIKSRLNKDNFWNLMFWRGICFSVFLSEQIADFSGIGGLVSLVLSLTLIPYILTRFNQVKYTDNKIFLNSQGEDLTNRLPKRLGIAF
ncbi:hypothetical protein [Candidatus Tisiphia endosymbiont of Dioctria rufipes]|uniref:hypothetical protein n=1 Tax=Candidatus Tisiphia endosymbiont of Dioctria rufipes TaxID=3066255 RepID=UPI00312C91F0